MGAEGRPTYDDVHSSDDSKAESTSDSEAEFEDSNSDSHNDSTESSEEEIVDSRPRTDNVSSVHYSDRGMRVKQLAEELAEVSFLIHSPRSATDDESLVVRNASHADLRVSWSRFRGSRDRHHRICSVERIQTQSKSFHHRPIRPSVLSP